MNELIAFDKIAAWSFIVFGIAANDEANENPEPRVSINRALLNAVILFGLSDNVS